MKKLYAVCEHSLYENGAITLPLKVGEYLKNRHIKKVYVTRGLNGCLFVFSRFIWEAHMSKLKSLGPASDKGLRKSTRQLFFSGAEPFQFRANNYERIPISESLRDYAMITKEIVVVVLAKRIEIWDKKGWDINWEEGYEKVNFN